MENPEIKIGYCSHKNDYPKNLKGFLLNEDLAIYCLDHNEIVLGKRINDSLIERTLNHEMVHAVLNAILDKNICCKFDNLFIDKEDLFNTYGLHGEPQEIIRKLETRK